MLALVFLVVNFSMYQCTNVISSRNVSWMEARDLCTMVAPEIMNNGYLKSNLPILDDTVTTSRAWIGKYISQSKWIQFEGCFNTPDTSNVSTFDISEYSGNRVWMCHNMCSGNHFGVTATSCQCFLGSTRYADIALVCGPNYRNESNGGFYGVSGCVCKYTKSNEAFSESNQGNCVNILFSRTGLRTKIAPCHSSNYLLCVTGQGSGSFRSIPRNRESWFDNVKECQSGKYILPKRGEFGSIQPKPDRTYWLNTFRIQLYHDHRQLTRNLPKQCLALRISENSGIGTEIRNCSDHLPVVCATRLNQPEDGVSSTIILISAVIGSCVLVGIIVFCLLGRNKYRQRISDQQNTARESDRQSHLMSDQQNTAGGGDTHDYHEIEMNAIESSPIGIYNILHETRHVDVTGATSVYDHVQNSDYDEISKLGTKNKSAPTEYDHVLNFKN